MRAMRTILKALPPPGTKIALAFSGGLDTRTAAAWLSERGLSVCAYTADLGQPDESPQRNASPQGNASPVEGVARIAKEHGATLARVLDVRESLAREGFVALACGAFHLATAGRKYFNTTPLGRAVTTRAIVRAMREDGVNVFSDGSTHKGNDIQRFFRYALLENPEVQIYKPWLDDAFVTQLGGRREMSLYLQGRGFPHSQAIEKAYSTDANALGATHEAKDLEELSTSVYAVDPIMGVRAWASDVSVEKETVEVSFDRGRPSAINGKKTNSNFEALVRANEIGGRHGLGISDQVENRVIEAKSRGIYKAPGMALLHIAYERILSVVAAENVIELYATLGRRLGRWLYEGRWFDPEAGIIKQGLLNGAAKHVTGSVTIDLRRGDDYTIVRTEAKNALYHPARLSMERSEAAFLPEDRIGQLEVGRLSVLDARTYGLMATPSDDAAWWTAGA